MTLQTHLDQRWKRVRDQARGAQICVLLGASAFEAHKEDAEKLKPFMPHNATVKIYGDNVDGEHMAVSAPLEMANETLRKASQHFCVALVIAIDTAPCYHCITILDNRTRIETISPLVDDLI